MLAEMPVASISIIYKSDKSATRIDIALLVSALFLQRFSLPFGNTFLHLDLVSIGLILLHQFLSGKLLIQYDRFLLFLGLVLASTCSLLLNFDSTMLTAYFLFVIFYWLFTLTRPSTPDQYKSTLQAFQFLVMLLSCLGIAQFVAQFVVNGKELVQFYGIVPDLLVSGDSAFITNDARTLNNGVIKSTGMFLAEASILSQMTALGILIEVLEFGRPRYLLVMALGFLLAYSGTGLMLLLLFLPLAGLRHGRAGLSALLIVMFAFGLFATGIVDLSAFSSRVDEVEPGSSGFERFIAPLWLTAKQFDTGSLQALLVGSGPGMVKTVADTWYGGSLAIWFKLFYEYGIIGSFIFCCFLASCFRRSRCPGIVIVAVVFAHFVLAGTMTIAIALCTLNGPEPRRARIDQASRYGRPRVPEPVSG
jgi:hypothetical protein